MSTGQVAIDEALTHGDPQDVTESVKMIVAKEIAAVNSELRIQRTEYFNHSYIPDLVTWWGPNDADHREVFLRFDSADRSLALDIERLSRDHPMFFSLRPHRVEEASPEVAEALSQHRRVMVTEASALNELSGSEPGSFESLVSTSVVRAGRGLVDKEQATRARQDTQGSIKAALLGDEPRTRAAVATTRAILADAASQEIGKYLQMLWLAGGGELDAYPGDRDVGLVAGARDVERLVRLVLSSEVVDSIGFWRRLGSMVTLEVLENLESVELLPNLQHLVNANVSRLFVSYAAVSEHEPRLTSVQSPFSWLVVDSRLCLDGPEWTIAFADDGRHFSGVSKDRRLPTIEEVNRRAWEFLIEAVELDDENLLVTVEPKDPDGLRFHGAIGGLSGVSGLPTLVRSITVRNGVAIEVEYDRLIANTRQHKIPLPQLADVAVALMTDSDEIEGLKLRKLLGLGSDEGSLFGE